MLSPLACGFELKGFDVAKVAKVRYCMNFPHPVRGVDAIHMRFPLMLLFIENQCLSTVREETDVWLEVFVDVTTDNNELAEQAWQRY